MLVTLPEGNPYQPLLESQTAWPRGLPNLAEALQWRCQNNALFFWMGLYINKKRLPMEQVTILTIPACSCTCTYSSNIYIYTVNIYTHNIHNIHNIHFDIDDKPCLAPGGSMSLRSSSSMGSTSPSWSSSKVTQPSRLRSISCDVTPQRWLIWWGKGGANI